MRRIALAVLLVLFMLSAALPLTGAPPAEQLDAAPLAYENPGIDDGTTLFDEFSRTLIFTGEPKKSLLADLDGDDLGDMAVIFNGSADLNIYYCDPVNGFTISDRTVVTLLNNITDMAIGDMDADGKQDIVLVLNTKSSNNLVVLYQSTNYQLASSYQKTIDYIPLAVEVGNFTGNNRPEIALLTNGITPNQPRFAIYEWTGTYELWVDWIPLYNLPLNMVEPRLITSGDLNINQDSLRDLVIGDSASGTVAGFLNPGTPFWGNSIRISRHGPTALMLSDMDDDAPLELTVAEEGAESPSITLWDCSDSGFTPIVNIDTLSTMDSLASFQLNTDLRKEIVAASASSADITVFRASTSGDLLYQTSIRSPVPKSPKSVTSADLNGDGEGDIVLTSSPSVGYGALTIYYQSGDSVSNANDNQPLDDTSISLATVGDCDGEAEEVVTYDTLSRSITFSREGAPAIRDMLGPENVTVMECHDLNGDGLEDLVMVSSYPRQAHVWFGDPDMLSLSYTPVKVDLSYSMTLASSLAVGDLDGDGDTDLAVGGVGGLDIFWNSGTGTPFSQEQRSTLTLSGASVASMAAIRVQGSSHNDVLTDLAIVNASSSRIEVYFQQTGATKFVASDRLLLNNLPGISGLIASDLNGDGRQDLLTSTPLALHLYVQSGIYTKGFLDGQPIKDLAVQEAVECYTVGDIDDDGRPELAFSTENSTIEGYDFDGTAFTRLTRQTAGAALSFLSLRDMDDDLKVDLVAVSALSRTISFYYQNNFAPVASGNAVGSDFFEGSSVSFDGSSSTDSYSDIATLNYTWTFSNDGAEYGKTCSHVFMEDGVFTVTLTVRDQGGLTDDYILPPVNVQDLGPKAIGECIDSVIIENQTAARFVDHSTSWPDNITAWLWDFDDGSTSTSPNPTHVFSHDGIYNVTLMVTDDDGDENVSSVIQVTVSNTPPIADFEVTTSSPVEGSVVQFEDRSRSPADEIISWFWNFGDGGTSLLRNPTYVYAYNGNYKVTLNVTDSDGITNETYLFVDIADTSPGSVSIEVVGSPSFYESEEIVFIVEASETGDDIERYSWDFQGTSIKEYANTTVNTISHIFNESGNVRITVRVWDNDSYTESNITISIMNLAPDANFTYRINGGNVSFDAKTSSDTENDLLNLQFRWYIEGVWYVWSSDPIKNYTFSQDGTYPVRLEVRDDDGKIDNITKSVTIELYGPTIELIDPILRVNVSESITVRAIVTDASGVESVILQYVIDNVTTNVTMTLEGEHTYFGQIPEQNIAMEITYRIIAEDSVGNVAITDDITLSIVEPPDSDENDDSLFLPISLLLLGVLLMLMAYLYLSRPIVDEVFVLYHDGTLLAHQTRRLKPGMDDEILGGMLIALQNFVRDSFKDENSTVLRRMDFGERKLLVERKDDFFMAVMLSGKRAGNAATRMMKVLDSIEESYAPVLKEWDGDLEKVRGIRDETKPMFSRANPLDRLKRKEGEDDSI